MRFHLRADLTGDTAHSDPHGSGMVLIVYHADDNHWENMIT
jgi:hypothetical protein